MRYCHRCNRRRVPIGMRSQRVSGCRRVVPRYSFYEVFAGPQLCARIDAVSICVPCTRFQENFGITTAADCELFSGTDFGSQTADVVANYQRECFGFYACTTNADCPDTLPICNAGQCLAECDTNADCPDTLPICNAGQCEISIFSPLDGMGGGSSA